VSRLALLHHRLTALMALAALVAFGAGAGFASPAVVLAAAGLGVALVWVPAPEWDARLEQMIRIGALGLLAWVAYVALLSGGDFLVPVLALLLFLLAGEVLRGPAAHTELRRYTLAFALLIAATAYYPGPLFAAAFVAYVALTTVSMMVGHLRREAERHGIAELRLGRHFLLATAALSGLTVLTGALLFAAFPRLPRNWFGPARGGSGAAMVGFGDGVSLGDFGTRISPNPEIVFRVEFEGGAPPAGELYWRGRSYDHFDGVRWTRSHDLPPAAPPPRWYTRQWGGATVSYQIYGGPPGAEVLFGLHPLLGVRPVTAFRSFTEPSGDVRFRGGESPIYRAVSLAAQPGAEMLRAAPDAPGPASAHYLQLPRLSARVHALADSLTHDLPTRYDRVRAIERYFESGFAYTTELPATRREATLEHFLFHRRAGHCEYYSSAMVVLLRAAGIEARNVTGFAGGEWGRGDSYLAVTQNQAHSWVEAWLPEYGWVRSDPTPAAGEAARGAAGSGIAAPAWALRLWLSGMEHRWY
jgi:transglutaminase-like putative cysteine protease